jgi:hypothetical protein
MKRVTYNGQSLITGTAVSQAVVHYVTNVAVPAAAIAVEIPVLEQNNTVLRHTLILSAATQLVVTDVDGVTGDEETRRFPVPLLPPVGARATAIDIDDPATIVPLIDEDPLGLAADSIATVLPTYAPRGLS